MSRRLPALTGWVALLLAVLVPLAGCTGVPSDSAPLVVRTVDRAGPGVSQPNISPKPGADPREHRQRLPARRGLLPTPGTRRPGSS